MELNSDEFFQELEMSAGNRAAEKAIAHARGSDILGRACMGYTPPPPPPPSRPTKVNKVHMKCNKCGAEPSRKGIQYCIKCGGRILERKSK